MPYKTKKQKMKSKIRQQSSQKDEVSHAPTPEVSSSIPTFSFQSTSVKRPTIENKDSYFYLRNDLLRTIVVAIVCFGVLIGLSFVLK